MSCILRRSFFLFWFFGNKHNSFCEHNLYVTRFSGFWPHTNPKKAIEPLFHSNWPPNKCNFNSFNFLIIVITFGLAYISHNLCFILLWFSHANEEKKKNKLNRCSTFWLYWPKCWCLERKIKTTFTHALHQQTLFWRKKIWLQKHDMIPICLFDAQHTEAQLLSRCFSINFHWLTF